MVLEKHTSRTSRFFKGRPFVRKLVASESDAQRKMLQRVIAQNVFFW
jgi:hypothetical protein